MDSGVGNIPIAGWLTGSDARNAEERAAQEAALNKGIWADTENYWYSPDDLTVNYEEYDYADGPDRSEAGAAYADQESIDAQYDALRSLQDVYQSGGMTAADRARQQQARISTGMATRAQRDADLAAREARGMGGSGANIAARIAGQQAGAMGLAGADAEMQTLAQERALQAMQYAGAISEQARGQSFDERHRSGTSVDEFNKTNTERLQEWMNSNTDTRNKTRESRRDARNESMARRERLAAGMTGDYSTDVSRRAAEGARKDETNKDAGAAIATWLGG
jgi:hypothetical protein